MVTAIGKAVRVTLLGEKIEINPHRGDACRRDQTYLTSSMTAGHRSSTVRTASANWPRPLSKIDKDVQGLLDLGRVVT